MITVLQWLQSFTSGAYDLKIDTGKIKRGEERAKRDERKELGLLVYFGGRDKGKGRMILKIISMQMIHTLVHYKWNKQQAFHDNSSSSGEHQN